MRQVGRREDCRKALGVLEEGVPLGHEGVAHSVPPNSRQRLNVGAGNHKTLGGRAGKRNEASMSWAVFPNNTGVGQFHPS